MHYGRVVRNIRKSMNMSLRQFAVKVGLQHSHVDRIEREFSDKSQERLAIPIDTLKQICDRTNYSFRQFLEEAGYIEKVQELPNELVGYLSLGEADKANIVVQIQEGLLRLKKI